MTLYLWVSKDEFELPLYVSDSLSELATVTNTRKNTISSIICKHKKGIIKKTRFVAVEVDDE